MFLFFKCEKKAVSGIKQYPKEFFAFASPTRITTKSLYLYG